MQDDEDERYITFLDPWLESYAGAGQGSESGSGSRTVTKKTRTLVACLHNAFYVTHCLYNSTFTSDLAGNVPAFRYHTYQLESITVASPILYPWASYNIR